MKRSTAVLFLLLPVPAGDPAIQKMKRCREMMSGMMPGLPCMDQAGAADVSENHVCDQ